MIDEPRWHFDCRPPAGPGRSITDGRLAVRGRITYYLDADPLVPTISGDNEAPFGPTCACEKGSHEKDPLSI